MIDRGYLALKDRPELQGLPGQRTTLFGFIGGEKSAFLGDPDVVSALGGYGLQLDTRVAGSVISFEAVRATRRMVIPLRLTSVIPVMARLKEAAVAPKITTLRESFFKR